MIREKSNWKPQEDESTDAEHRGGMTRSSNELSEKGREQRGHVVQRYSGANQEWDEPNG